LLLAANSSRRQSKSQVQYEFEVEKTKIGVFDAESIRAMLGDVEVIDIEGDGTCEYLARVGLDGAAVFDARDAQELLVGGSETVWCYRAR
jgi:hypothetical protein